MVLAQAMAEEYVLVRKRPGRDTANELGHVQVRSEFIP